MTTSKGVWWINADFVKNVETGGDPRWVRADGLPGDPPPDIQRIVPLDEQYSAQDADK